MPPFVMEEMLKALLPSDQAKTIHIFGYGSLIWKPNFPFKNRTIGHINGYKRRFYQGTTTHRGTPEWPGRVATVLKSEKPTAKVWGVSYEVEGLEDIKAALAHLAEREMILGGYRFDKVTFHPFPFDRKVKEQPSYEVLVYIAEPSNDQYLGKSSLEQLAFEIANAEGQCGRNIEYLKKVAIFMFQEVPNGQDKDKHIFKLVRQTEAYLYGEEDPPEGVVKLPAKVAVAHEDAKLPEQRAADYISLPAISQDIYTDSYLRQIAF